MSTCIRPRGSRPGTTPLVLPLVLAASWLLATSGEAQVAQFRVTDVQLLKDSQAKVTIHWTYSKGASSSSYTGDGVKFRVHTTLPGRWYTETQGTPVKDIVDMKGGTGFATLTVPVPKGAKPGADLVLTGEWKSGHRWGTDSARPGGQFKLPTQVTAVQLHLNKAAAADLVQLPGVGPALAQRIVTFRDQQKGKKIRSIDDLTQVKGISAAKLTTLGPLLTTKAPPTPKKPLSVNINTATEAQLLALPGVGPGRAKAIVDFRAKMKQNRYSYSRKFQAPGELNRVPGVSRSLAAKLVPMLSVSGRTTGVPRVKQNSRLRSRGSWLGASRPSPRYTPRRALR